MTELRDSYQGKKAVLFGANSRVGLEIGRYLTGQGVELGLIDLAAYEQRNLAEDIGGRIVYKTVLPGREESFQQAAAEIAGELGRIDYLICAYYFEEMNREISPDDLDLDTWDRLMEAWVLSYFLTARAVTPYMLQNQAGRIVFVNTTNGYTGEGEGEGELSGQGSIHECAGSSAITGMMTSIARDLIPKGISVNGLALGPDYLGRLEAFRWGLNLWLSGISEYACAQILRLY